MLDANIFQDPPLKVVVVDVSATNLDICFCCSLVGACESDIEAERLVYSTSCGRERRGGACWEWKRLT